MASMQIPNKDQPGAHLNSSGQMNRGGQVVHAPNTTDQGDRRNGTSPLGGSAGAIKPPALHHFPAGHSSQR